MIYSKDVDPGKRDASASEDAISEVQEKVQGVGKDPNLVPSDGWKRWIFFSLLCTGISGI